MSARTLTDAHLADEHVEEPHPSCVHCSHARLIAAAPELLAALEDAISELDEVHEKYGEQRVRGKLARAAIARARGDK